MEKDFSTKACSGKPRGDGFTLKEGRFSLDIRKTFFMMRVVRHGNRLSREVVDALSQKRSRLDGALSNLIKLKMSLPMAGGWTISLKGPLQPKPFYDAVIVMPSVSVTLMIMTVPV